MPELIVRPYRQGDRDAVHRIAADTAFFGEPVEVFLDDRRLFCDAFCGYYTDLEPELAGVLEVDGEVAGYLFGCRDTRAQQRVWARRILPALLAHVVSGRYRLGRRTWRYAGAMLVAALRGEYPHVDLSAYPAHLHINLDRRWRGLGGGRRLLSAYLDHLRSLHVPGVHLRTTSENPAAVGLYTRLGFQMLDARPARLWDHYVDRPVENRLYGLRLSE